VPQANSDDRERGASVARVDGGRGRDCGGPGWLDPRAAQSEHAQNAQPASPPVDGKVLRMIEKFFVRDHKEQYSTVTVQSSGLGQFAARAAKAPLSPGVRAVDLPTLCSPKGGNTCKLGVWQNIAAWRQRSSQS
jgi:hypothetical protein